MKNIRTIRILVFFITGLAIISALTGILSKSGPGNYEFTSIHDQSVTIYGKGIYQHMSAEVAVQGIAHDYVTLFLAIPLLLMGFFWSEKGSYRGRFLLAGLFGFFLVTFLFYTVMGTYNRLFLIYIALTFLSFFGLILTLMSIDLLRIENFFDQKTPVKLIGGFLVFQATMVAFLWLSIIIPPLADGTIYPVEVAHYTTLVVQGLDLGLLLPIAFISGILLLKRRPYGYLFGSVFMIFLAVFMFALTAKIISQLMIGIDAGPAIFIIPLMNLIAVMCGILVIKSIKSKG